MTDPDPAFATPPEPTPAPTPSVFGSRPWSPLAASWLVALTFVVSLFGSLAIREALSRDYSDTVTTLLVGGILTLGYLIELAAVRSVTISQGSRPAETVGLVRPRAVSPMTWIGAAIGGALVARAFAAIYSLLINRLGLTLPGANSDPLSVFPGGGISVVVLFAVVVFIAPFAEEVVFRGVLLPALGARWGTLYAVAISSALFATFHVSVYLFLPILVAAIIFARLAVRFGSLWPSYLAHATFNGVAAVAVLVLKAKGLA